MAAGKVISLMDDKTRSHGSDKLDRTRATRTSFKGTSYKEGIGIREGKGEGFTATPDSPSFQTWKAYCSETNQAALLRELENREQCGRAFNFPSEWPSCAFPRSERGETMS